VKGGQSQRREVRGAGGANGVKCGKGVSPFHRRRGLGRGLCPLPRIFLKFFLVQCVQNIFAFRPRGGGIAQCPPPKYATDDRAFSVAAPRHEIMSHRYRYNSNQWVIRVLGVRAEATTCARNFFLREWGGARAG